MSVLLAIGAGAIASSIVILTGRKKNAKAIDVITDCWKNYCTFTFNWNGDVIKYQINNYGNRFYLLDEEILYTDNIGLLARMIFSEAGSCSFQEKIWIGEVARNRVVDNATNSEKYCWNRYFKKYKTIYDVITKTGFDGVKGNRFYPTKYLNYPLEKKSYIDSLSAAIKVLNQRTNWSNFSLYFNKGGQNPCDYSFLKTSPDNFKHSFYAPKN